MNRKIIIEPWKADSTYVHVHEPGRDGIQGSDSAVCSDMTVERARRLGAISRMIHERSDGTFLRSPHSCQPFCDMLGDVSCYSAKQIAEARGQLEDAGFDGDIGGTVANMCDDKVAFLDWYVRELWAEHVRDVDNPFTDDVRLKYDMIDTLNEFCPLPEPDIA
jgi:hypothetical protein|tara:strand:+ start:165 stop:653 length:489 start_codon:yes stop_codon:yes gene_type:complete